MEADYACRRYQDQVAHSQQPQYGIAYEATAIIILLPCRQQYSNMYKILRDTLPFGAVVQGVQSAEAAFVLGQQSALWRCTNYWLCGGATAATAASPAVLGSRSSRSTRAGNNLRLELFPPGALRKPCRGPPAASCLLSLFVYYGGQPPNPHSSLRSRKAHEVRASVPGPQAPRYLLGWR
jgi:hypothetical protein